MAHENSAIEGNFKGVSMGVTDDASLYTTMFRVDPVTLRLKVDAAITSGAGGTQYTEADTDASITGTAALMEGAGNALVPLQGTAAAGLLVNLGTNNDVTVTGSVTANAGTNLNTSTLALEAGGNLATIAGAISATHMQVDVLSAPSTAVTGTFWQATQPVSVATIPSHAVTNAGTFAVQPGTAVTGPGNPVIDSYTHLAINLNAAADQVLVASAANKQIWVYAVAYTCSVAGTVSFQDEDNLAITGIMDHAANSGLAIGASGNFAMPLWKLGTDKDLEVDVVTAAIDGFITYALVSV